MSMELSGQKEAAETIKEFLEFVYGESSGYCYVATKHPTVQQNFSQHFFNWPQEKELAVAHIINKSADHEVYYAPSLFTDRTSKKESFKSSNVLWVEFDGNSPNGELEVPEPTLRIRSSQDGHEHWYWRIEGGASLQELESLNRTLTYTLGADVSGWDAGQILRPPATINHKRQLPVEIIEKNDKVYKKLDFEGLQEPPPLVQVSLPDTLPAIEDCIASVPFPASLWTLFKEGVGEGQRSSGLMALGYGLAELGVDPNTMLALLLNADARWGKFANRSDQLLRLAEIVTRAKEKYPEGVQLTVGQQELQPLVKFGFMDLIESDIQIEWVWEGFLQKEGYMLVTGPSGTGKTQMALNLGEYFVLGKDFLGRPVFNNDSGRVAFFSLEMGPADLKLFIEQQAQGFSEEEKHNLNGKFDLYPLGEPLYLDQASERERVERIIQTDGLKGIIIDSLGSITEDELTNERQIKILMNWIDYVRRRYGIFVILIHHHRKASGDNKKPNKLSDVYGSFFITRNATTVLCLWDSNGNLQAIPLKVRLAAKPVPFGIVRSEFLLFTRKDLSDAEVKELIEEVDLNPDFVLGEGKAPGDGTVSPY